MFEKKVEEYIDKLTTNWFDGEYSFSVEELRQAIFYAAEFGYNKAKEEYEVEMKVLTQNRDELLAEIERLEERIGELSECY